MPDQLSNLYIYHIKDPLGRSKFYHSIENPKDFTLLTAASKVQGFYGTEPDIEAFRQFKQSIHQEIKEEIFHQSLARTFIPRFLFSALVFLIIFLFLSLAIRDPIPLVDEILIALVGASVVWIVKSKKIKRNNQEAEQELLIRDVIEHGFFAPNDQFKLLEKLWYEVYLDLQNQQLEDIESYIISLTSSRSEVEPGTLQSTKSLEEMISKQIPAKSKKEILNSVTTVSKGKLLSLWKKNTLLAILKKDYDQGYGLEQILYFILVVFRIFRGVA